MVVLCIQAMLRGWGWRAKSENFAPPGAETP
jgi:hypothetical protein